MGAPDRRASWRNTGAGAIVVGKSLEWLAETQTQGGSHG
jgi:hypothetical protein